MAANEFEDGYSALSHDHYGEHISSTTPTIVVGVTNEKISSNMDFAVPPSHPSTPDSLPHGRPTSPSSGRSASTPPRQQLGRKSLLYPEGDFRNSSTPELRDLKSDMMCNWLHQQQLERMWTTNGIEEGVMLKKAKDDYTCAPEDLRARPDGVFDAVRRLNVKVIRQNFVTRTF